MKQSNPTQDLTIGDAWPILAKQGPVTADGRFNASSTEDVVQAVKDAAAKKVSVIAVGARSGVSGALVCTRNAVLLDLTDMKRILHFDETAMTVEVEAGVMGGELEAWLNERGFTCGHYPQSLHISTVGGWLSTRGIGTFSNKYGGIENLVLGLEAVLPDGQILSLSSVPRSAAGPRLVELFLGSEGTFGVITKITLKVFVRPETVRFATYSCSSLDVGITATRKLFVKSAIPALLRLYDQAESIHLYEKAGLASGDPLLIVGHEGPSALVDAEAAYVASILEAAGCKNADPSIGEAWNAGRYRAEWLEQGNAAPNRIADSIEVSVSWPNLIPLYESVMRDIEPLCDWKMAHLSHFYQTGSMFYFIFGLEDEDQARLADRYARIWAIVQENALAKGGTCTHHHGVGAARRDFFERELGPVGMHVLREIKTAIDPRQTLNPGALSLVRK